MCIYQDIVFAKYFILNWWFPKIGVPPNHLFSSGFPVFPHKPSIVWVPPMTMETPKLGAANLGLDGIATQAPTAPQFYGDMSEDEPEEKSPSD